MTEGFFRFGPVQRMIVAFNVAAVSSYALYHQIPTRRSFLPSGDSTVPVPPSWDVPTRDECLRRLRAASNIDTPLDVLIIGGGATGSGIALDLMSRGPVDGSFTVGLVEAGDFASETSSRSSKLIHGGVRYLEKAIFGCDIMQLKLVFEALKERSVMLHQAPFLCQPLDTVIPAYSAFDLAFYWAGMKAYDLVAIAGRGVIGDVSYWQNPISTLNRHPHLKHRSPVGQTLAGSIVYSDGVHDDARMCLLAALTSACYGAATVNHCRAVCINTLYPKGMSNDEAEAKKTPCNLVEVTLKDQLSGAEFKVHARSVINAAGPFSDQVRALLRGKDHKATLAPSAGTHISLPVKYAPKGGAMLVPTSDGRVLFVIGWKGHCIAGTTDKPTEVSANPQGTEGEVQFILESMKPYLGEIERNEVRSVWSGIRPLAAPPSNSKGGTQNIIREHFVQVDDQRRMVSITGGKWTTYRKIAEDAVNALFDSNLVDRSRLRLQGKESPTDEIQLLGAVGYEPNSISLPIEKATPKDILAHWRSSYGERYTKLFEIAQSIPKVASGVASPTTIPVAASSSSGNTSNLPTTIAAADSDRLLASNTTKPLSVQLIHRDFPVTTADVAYAARYEHCMTIEDFIARRCRIAFIDVVAAREASLVVADVLAREHKWSSKEKAAQLSDIAAYLKRFDAKPDE